jgi:hypothetical protein
MRVSGPALALAVLLVIAIAASHALTGVMVCVALTALVLTRVCGARVLPYAAIVITAGWDASLARDFVNAQGSSTLAQIRLPWTTTQSSLTAVGQLSANQALVAHVARGVVVAMAGLAGLGALRWWRAGTLNRAALVLAAAPAILYGTGNYDGEILFRIYLFAVPFLALLAAYHLVRRPIVAFATMVALLGAFLVAYYGKERQNYFTPSEVTAARYLYTHAPPGALLIDGTHNYPAQFENYERYRYVSISREPAASRARLLAHPGVVLASWMRPRRSAFVILTRSQEVEADELGSMPHGSITRIERALSASRRFRVVLRNRDAAIFALARGGATP